MHPSSQFSTQCGGVSNHEKECQQEVLHFNRQCTCTQVYAEYEPRRIVMGVQNLLPLFADVKVFSPSLGFQAHYMQNRGEILYFGEIRIAECSMMAHLCGATCEECMFSLMVSEKSLERTFLC